MYLCVTIKLRSAKITTNIVYAVFGTYALVSGEKYLFE